ncbi:MAG: hypothetical protein ACPGYP_01230, partial [Solirubrobacterales bacterium]
MQTIKNLASRGYVKAGVVGSGAALAVPGRALAAQDYSDVGTAATGEITAVIPVALGVLALAIGIPLAIR